MNESIALQAERIEVGAIEYSSFSSTINGHYHNAKIVVLMDTNTHDLCWNWLQTTVNVLQRTQMIVVPPGEENKTISVCTQVWEALLEYELSRHDLLINLGGGLITDMGGFIASVFKRGIDFINIPTSLLGMIDASFGGKNGVNFFGFKNQLGVFQHPIATYIDKRFLHTLPAEHIKNGWAEIIKHALIGDRELWHSIVQLETLSDDISNDIFERSLSIKITVVAADPHERGMRKILNFGHTIGHALEAYFLTRQYLAHGHAVALGIIAECYIARKLKKLATDDFVQITTFLKKHFHIPKIDHLAVAEIVQLLHSDKKNYGGQIQCAFIDKIGNCLYDQAVTEEICAESLQFLFFNTPEA